VADKEVCDAHSGVCVEIVNLKQADTEQWKSINGIRDKIDGMKNWLIGILATLCLQIVLTIGAWLLNQ